MNINDHDISSFLSVADKPVHYLSMFCLLMKFPHQVFFSFISSCLSESCAQRSVTPSACRHFPLSSYSPINMEKKKTLSMWTWSLIVLFSKHWFSLTSYVALFVLDEPSMPVLSTVCLIRSAFRQTSFIECRKTTQWQCWIPTPLIFVCKDNRLPCW